MANIWTSSATEIEMGKLMENCVCPSSRERIWTNERAPEAKTYVFILIWEWRMRNIYWIYSSRMAISLFKWINLNILTLRSLWVERVCVCFFSSFFHFIDCSDGESNGKFCRLTIQWLIKIFHLFASHSRCPAAVALFGCLCFCCLLSARSGREPVFESTYRYECLRN